MLFFNTKDKVFSKKKRYIGKFVFNKKVAAVFNDMLDRSVPFYKEVIRMTAEISRDYFRKGSTIYDLGCSTGTQIIALHNMISNACITGVDNSPAMINKAVKNIKKAGYDSNTKLVCRDINSSPPENCSVCIMNYTLQFIQPEQRSGLLQSIYRNLLPGGILILSEKTKTGPEFFLDSRRYYFDMKRRNGYSELEIANKRDALEERLIPFTEKKLIELAAAAGFREYSVFFKWYLFTSLVLKK
ncbi:MAG TPA: carboxy-S-adenosyl-L-methionine synthase CmoA [Spirochaetota bacterium]|nr:carboxy-S-adenosyl-L-methionine synthase CmoA [Spirochaetota bacterium]